MLCDGKIFWFWYSHSDRRLFEITIRVLNWIGVNGLSVAEFGLEILGVESRRAGRLWGMGKGVSPNIFLNLMPEHSLFSQYGTFISDLECKREQIKLHTKTSGLWSYLNRPDVLNLLEINQVSSHKDWANLINNRSESSGHALQNIIYVSCDKFMWKPSWPILPSTTVN